MCPSTRLANEPREASFVIKPSRPRRCGSGVSYLTPEVEENLKRRDPNIPLIPAFKLCSGQLKGRDSPRQDNHSRSSSSELGTTRKGPDQTVTFPYEPLTDQSNAQPHNAEEQTQ
ncbi:hypothetical protein CHU98_g9405 [Xylaria longipes]|nr:hypothetical protein CHU98_g9405 [Xylaria longipes]